MKKGAESAIIHNQFEIERYALGKMGSNIKPPTRKKLASLRAEEDAAFERSKEMDRQEEYEKPRKFTRKKLTTRRLITMRKNKKTR
jgi:hypothetical protein